MIVHLGERSLSLYAMQTVLKFVNLDNIHQISYLPNCLLVIFKLILSIIILLSFADHFKFEVQIMNTSTSKIPMGRTCRN